MMTYDVLVVGGGLIGMLTARTLQMQGYRVAILEKNQLGGGASWAAGGILSAVYPWQHSKALQQLVALGQAAFPALATDLFDETGIDSQLLHSGMVMLDAGEYEAACAWAQETNRRVELIEREPLQHLEPNLDKRFAQALHLPQVMQIRPPQLIKAVRQSLSNLSVHIIEHTGVKQIKHAAGKVIGVSTDQHTLHSEHVVVCTGAWTQRLLPESPAPATDIAPVRGQMLLFRPVQDLSAHIMVQEGFYLIPRCDRYLLCGSTLEHAGFDNTPTTTAKELLHTRASQFFPALQHEEVIKHWSGLRPGSARDTPYICAHQEIAGLYINAGHHRHGIVMSIPSAKIAADLVIYQGCPPQNLAYPC